MAFSLKAVLGLETTKFERGIASARKKLSSGVGGMMKSLAPLAGFVGFSAMANGALNLAREVTNLSKVANTSGEDFQRMAFGAKTVGVEQEKLADILKDTGDKIGDFLQTGGGPMADFFENIAPKIGVTADMFRDLSGPDALQLYYDSLDRANLSQNEMTFFMEAIASDATLLIPLLKDGGKGFEELGKQAEAAGLIMSDLEREKLEKVNLRMDVMKKRGTILAGTLLTKIIPALQILSNGLGFVADVFGAAAAVAVQFGASLGRVVSAVIQPAISAFESLSKAIEAGAQAMAGNFDEAKTAIKEAKEEAKEIVGDIKAIPGEMAEAGKEVARTVESAFETLGDSVDKRSKDITSAVDDIMGRNEELVETLVEVKNASDKANDSMSGGGSGSGSGKGKQIEMEQKLRKMKLEALKAEVRGETELAEAMNKRIDLAERMLKIMRETGATQREAAIIANSQQAADAKKPSKVGGDSGDTVRGKIRTGRIETGKVGESGFQSRFGPDGEYGDTPTMDQRERAAGLSNTMWGRTKPEDIAGASASEKSSDPFEKALKPATKKLDEMATDMKTIAEEMTKGES